MSEAPSVPPAPAVPIAAPEEKLERLPPEALHNYRKFVATGDEAALAGLVFEVLNYHLPKASAARAGTAWPAEARLVEELGFDSLATIETVFFFEDLFKISVSNEEIMGVATVGDLKQFLRAKLDAAKA